MVLESPAAVPAAPLKAGFGSFRELPLAGAVRVTAGAFVSTVNVLAVLVPVLPAASVCCACTVYVPSGSAAEGADQAPLPAGAVRVSTGLPEAVLPGYTRTVTVPESPEAVPALPPNVGLALFSAAPPAGWSRVT